MPSHWADASIIKYCLSGYFLAQRTTLILIQPLNLLFWILSFMFGCAGFSPVSASGATLQVRSKGCSLQRSPCLGARALGQAGCGGRGGTKGSRAQAQEPSHRLSCSGACGLPGPGVEPVSPSLAGAFFTLSHQGSTRPSFDQHLHSVFFQPVTSYLLTCDYIWMSFL